VAADLSADIGLEGDPLGDALLGVVGAEELAPDPKLLVKVGAQWHEAVFVGHYEGVHALLNDGQETEVFAREWKWE